MVRTSPTEKKDNGTVFLDAQEVLEFCSRQTNLNIGWDAISLLTDLHLLPMFNSKESQCFLRSDVESLLPVIVALASPQESDIKSESFFWETLALSPDTTVDLGVKRKIDPAFYSAFRNLLETANSGATVKNGPVENFLYFPPVRVLTNSPRVQSYAQHQIDRFAKAASSANDFARSAHYMGSKRNLTGFLVEAISSVLPERGYVVDLMCGSGAASGSFNKFWPTIASDVQTFCPILAVVQGAGFSTTAATNLIARMMPNARRHADSLLASLGEQVDLEERILHGDADESTLKNYHDFIDTFPTYPSEAKLGSWNPKIEVELRKVNNRRYPYCLFSAYFANVYFGLRQCVEIDSLRYAIDQLENEYEKTWALGSLITTLSSIGTTFAAHFAQPKYKDAASISLANISSVLEQRSFSVFHEFAVRLLNLAEESGKKNRRIEVQPGPWKLAIEALKESLVNQSVLVYLDAPYKREEYSRYYHVLETAVTYSYPASIGKGKLPSKGRERFRSEFFTKNADLVNDSFVTVLASILQCGWMCAWSYSDTGDADIPKVIKALCEKVDCRIMSYSTPYEHRSQGKGVSNKKVTEYVILFVPY